MTRWQCKVMRVGLAWAVALCALACVALSACHKAMPNPLPGKWEGTNSLTGKQVFWEFLPDGRLFTNNFTTQNQFTYRVEQPDVLRISFSGKFEETVQADELVYHFTLENPTTLIIRAKFMSSPVTERSKASLRARRRPRPMSGFRANSPSSDPSWPR